VLVQHSVSVDVQRERVPLLVGERRQIGIAQHERNVAALAAACADSRGGIDV
jgi:hypothetical protein